MQQLFAPKIRRKYNFSRLLTLDVHTSCSTGYKRDNVASYKFAQAGRLIAILRFSLCQVAIKLV